MRVRLFLAIATIFFLIVSGQNQLEAQQSKLPPLQVHPLPSSLARWQDKNNTGDYFSQVKSTPLGYLIWSEFPVKVYLEPAINSEIATSSNLRSQKWAKAVKTAIAQWNTYLPLIEVENPKLADIIIWRSPPKREFKLNQETGLYDIPRASTAKTNYEFYLKSGNPPTLSHRMKVEISPDLSPISILSAARHELGHALGIWGHSQQQTDALYFSQVRNTPAISPRDINTLKKIYQQPTKLGWRIL
jgi:predicted Zn-dependent protease